jgi:hypothetical protein
MKQATHGVKVDPPSADSICAVDLWIHQQPTDVTKSFAAYLEKDRAFRETLDEEAKEACRHDYDVGVQATWELFERAEGWKSR